MGGGPALVLFVDSSDHLKQKNKTKNVKIKFAFEDSNKLKASFLSFFKL